MTLVLVLSLVQAPAVVLENDYVRVAYNTVFCASSRVPGCGDRVIVALGDVELRSRGPARMLARGEIAVFEAGQSFQSLVGGPFFEVAFKAHHPSVASPAELVPAQGNALLYNGERFFVFEERLAVDETRPRHSHSQRVVIQLNRTRLQQWPDGEPEIIRDIEPDRVAFNPPVIHTVKNVGDMPLRGIVIEFHATAREPSQFSVQRRPPDVAVPIVGGVVGAAAGTVVGAAMGAAWVIDDLDAEAPVLLGVLLVGTGAVLGAMIGEPWGVACGVHIGNGRQGNPVPAILATSVVAAAGVGMALAAHEWRVLLAVPVVQIAVALPIERSTARGTDRRSRWCL